MLEPNEEDDEATTLKNWVEQGAPSGSPVKLPVVSSVLTALSAAPHGKRKRQCLTCTVQGYTGWHVLPAILQGPS